MTDRYISIQEVGDGYDYTIYNTDYRELDGGVYDNLIDYDGLIEKAEEAEKEHLEECIKNEVFIILLLAVFVMGKITKSQFFSYKISLLVLL